jgi:O-antigen/teichoic acid export membrane protein
MVSSVKDGSLLGTRWHACDMRDSIVGAIARHLSEPFLRVAALSAQFAILLLLGWSLPKSEMGNAMLAFAICRIGSQVVGLGIGHALFIRAAGDDSTAHVKAARVFTIVGLVSGTLLACGIAGLAGLIGGGLNKPGLVPWLVWLSPMALFGVLGSIQGSYLEARHKLASSILWTEAVPGLGRVVALLLLIPFGATAATASLAIWIPQAIAWLVPALSILSARGEGEVSLSLQDVTTAGGFAAYTAASLQLQGIDILVAGALFDSEFIAEYAVASRIATLFPFFSQLVVRRYSPHARALLQQGRLVALQALSDRTGRYSFFTLCGTVAIAILGAHILFSLVLSEYRNSIDILVLLAAAAILRGGFVPADRLLQISGNVRYSTWVMAASFSIVAFLPFLLSRYVGEAAIPAAMLLSAALLNPVLASLTLRRTTIRAYAPWAIVLAAAAAALIVGLICARTPEHVLAFSSALATGAAGLASYVFATKACAHSS